MAININGGLSVPGAYLTNSGGGSYPIFCSISTFSTFGMGDQDDMYIVLPGYKLLVYTNSSYTLDTGTNVQTIDNTTGTNILLYTVPTGYVNKGDSCKLYYQNNEIRTAYS